MPMPQPDEKKRQDATDQRSEPVEYPVDYLLSVMDTPAQVKCAIDALTGPFLESEIGVSCGQAAAQRLRESTGRTGLLDKIMRMGQSLGLTNDEMEVKGAYEKALRDGHVVVRVHAPTDDRKELAVRALRELRWPLYQLLREVHPGTDRSLDDDIIQHGLVHPPNKSAQRSLGIMMTGAAATENRHTRDRLVPPVPLLAVRYQVVVAFMPAWATARWRLSRYRQWPVEARFGRPSPRPRCLPAAPARTRGDGNANA